MSQGFADLRKSSLEVFNNTCLLFISGKKRDHKQASSDQERIMPRLWTKNHPVSSITHATVGGAPQLQHTRIHALIHWDSQWKGKDCSGRWHISPLSSESLTATPGQNAPEKTTGEWISRLRLLWQSPRQHSLYQPCLGIYLSMNSTTINFFCQGPFSNIQIVLVQGVVTMHSLQQSCKRELVLISLKSLPDDMIATANTNNTKARWTGGKVFCALLIQVDVQPDLRNIGNPMAVLIQQTVSVMITKPWKSHF